MYNKFHHGNEQLKNLEAIIGQYRSKHMQASEGHITLFFFFFAGTKTLGSVNSGSDITLPSG